MKQPPPAPRTPHPLAELTGARLREFQREPEAIFWVFVFPIVLALVLGFAFRERAPEPIPVGVAPGAQAPALLSALKRSGTLRPVALASAAEGRQRLRTGRIALVVEPGPPTVYRFDAVRPEARLARFAADGAIQAARGRRDAFSGKDELVREKGSRYIDFLLPGILGLNLMGTGMWGIGFGIVTARMKKTLKLFVATPMRRRDYLLSHMLARLCFFVFEFVAILAFGRFLFGVPIRGALPVVALVAFLGAASFSGLGLLTASRAQSLEVASGLMNLVMVPMWLVSGTFFSSERFPHAVQPVVRALPLTAVNDALRAVMLEGRPLAAVSSELAILIAWGLVSFAVALKLFRWQ